MKAIIQALLDSQLEDLGGTRISGQLCLEDSLVNELLQSLAQKSQTAPKNAGKTPTATPDIDPSTLLALLKIHSLRYETAQHKTLLSLDIAIAPHKK